MNAFAKLRIGVLGDFAADHYLVGKTSRISREAPVLILKKSEDAVLPGQAGNSAANLAALGVKCSAFGFTGEDREGSALAKALEEIGVATRGLITIPGARTIVKTRILAGAHHTALQQVIRLDDDEALVIGPADRRRLAARLSEALPELDAVLVSDYGYGVLNRSIWKRIGGGAKRKRGRPLLTLDSRYALKGYLGADLITPNETEVFDHLGIDRYAGADPVQAGRRLMRQTRCRGLLMTRGNEGMIVFDAKRSPVHLPIFGSDEVTDVTGAGDTVAAVATAVLAVGGGLVEAGRIANIAAGLSVMKRGAATVSAEELRQALGS